MLITAFKVSNSEGKDDLNASNRMNALGSPSFVSLRSIQEAGVF